MYKHGILGGTFDHFHVGHQRLIDKAFEVSENVTIGLSTKELYEKKFLAAVIENYQTREKILRDYLLRKKYLQRASIIPLTNIYGNALIEKNIDAIFVTNATVFNARKINFERQINGYPSLKIVTVPFIKSKDGLVIKSERIRLGEIDREGNVYMQIFGDRKRLLLPQNLRVELRKPFGKIISKPEEIKNYLQNHQMLISVGDICSLFLVKAGFHPDISIIDFKTRRLVLKREEMSSLIPLNVSPVAHKNKAGLIQKHVVNVFRQAIDKYLKTQEKQIIVVYGEEDLLALPAVLLAPLQSIVFYGQFEVGSVVVPVTEEKKQEVQTILKKFY